MSETRRDFLKQASAAMASMSLASNLWAAETDQNALPEGRFQLGLVTYQWGKDWTIDEIIANCTSTNFAGVELRSTHRHGVEITLNQQERAEVKRRFDDSQVEIVGLGSACEYHSIDPAVVAKNIQETKDFILLSKEIGGTGVKVRPNGLPKEVSIEQTIEQIGRSLNTCAQFAADHGQEIRLEVHGPGTSNIQKVHQMMEIADHPAARICWNCNAEDLAEPGFATNFQLLFPYLSTVHIHDLTIDSYPWVELFQELRKGGFQGWTLLEEGREPASIPTAMQQNHREWLRLRTEKI